MDLCVAILVYVSSNERGVRWTCVLPFSFMLAEKLGMESSTLRKDVSREWIMADMGWMDGGWIDDDTINRGVPFPFPVVIPPDAAISV